MAVTSNHDERGSDLLILLLSRRAGDRGSDSDSVLLLLSRSLLSILVVPLVLIG